MNNTKILSCNSIAGNSNTDLILNYLSNATILPKISLTSGQTLITDGLKISNSNIDLSGNRIIKLATGVDDTDCVNKLQMSNADNLRLLKGGDTMSGGLNMGGNIITNLPYPSSDITDAVNKNYCDTEDNKRLRLDGNSPMTGTLNMNSKSITNAPSIGAGSTISLKIATATIMQIQDLKVLMSTPIDMGGNSITNVSYINSNLTNPLILRHNSVEVVQIDASGITMRFQTNINMDGGAISNASLIMPIKTSQSSVYTAINSNNLNIGYTTSTSYDNNDGINIPPDTNNATQLLGTNNKLSVASGVWIITAMFTPYCFSGQPDSSRIQMFVSVGSTAATWDDFPASNCHQMLNGQYASTDSTRVVNTFVINLSSSKDLYLWGILNYSGAPAWKYNFAELRATRIA
jgi:hypothetical protein